MILRAAARDEVLSLFERHHAYAGISRSTTYLFAVEEPCGIVAAFAWQPPPPGAAKSVCAEAPHGVLALTGHVYKCSGWQPTIRSQRPQFVDADGVRRSAYANGRSGHAHLRSIGTATIQRWEHWSCERGDAARWMEAHGWQRVAVPGKQWRSGSPAFTWVRSLA